MRSFTSSYRYLYQVVIIYEKLLSKHVGMFPLELAMFLIYLLDKLSHHLVFFVSLVNFAIHCLTKCQYAPRCYFTPLSFCFNNVYQKEKMHFSCEHKK